MTVIAAPDARDVYALDLAGARLPRAAWMTACAACASPTRRRLGFAPRVHPEIESAVAAAAQDLREPRRQRRGGRSATSAATRSTRGTRSGGRRCSTSSQAFGDRCARSGRPGPAGGRRRPEPRRVSCRRPSCAPSCSAPQLHNVFVALPRDATICCSRRRCRCRRSRWASWCRRRASGARAWCDWAPFSYPFNLTTQPAASVPCGLTQRACRSACRSSARSAPTRWCCARAAPSRRPAPFPTLDAPRTG